MSDSFPTDPIAGSRNPRAVGATSTSASSRLLLVEAGWVVVVPLTAVDKETVVELAVDLAAAGREQH